MIFVQTKYCTYREDEAITTLENIKEEQSSSPHHVDEILRHVEFLPPEIYAVRFQPVAMEPTELAPIIGRLINGDDQ